MLKIVLLVTSLLFLSVPAQTETLSATEMVKRSDDLLRGDSHEGIYTMKVITPKWKRELKLRVWSKGRDKMFIRILSPAKEAGIATLRIGNEMWNYLPAVEKTLKIPPSMMLQPWMGSDFANDDLVKESSIVHDYTHRIIARGKVEGHSVSKIELLPKPKAPVVWGKIYRWVREGDFVPLKEEYYSEKGELIKVLNYSDIAKMSGRTIPRVWTMTPVKKKKHATIITVQEIKYNKPIREDIFTMAHLKKFK